MPDVSQTAVITPTPGADPSQAPANSTATTDPKTGHVKVVITPQADGAQAGARPAWLQDKFKSPEDLAKAYTELEKKLGAPKTEAAPAAPAAAPAAGTPAATPAIPDAAAAATAAASAGLDMEALTREYAENNGQLKQESLDKLAKIGVPKETVGLFVQGQEALRTQKVAQIEQAAGGKEQMNAALKWASTNLQKAEIDAVNNTFAKGDVAAATLAVQGIVARMTAQLGSSTTPVAGASVPGVAGDVAPFADNAQVVAAMRDPRYQTSEAYRRNVYARMAVSAFAGQPARK
jgi:Phage T7 capsid assembly protein